MKKHEKETIQNMAKESGLSISELVRIALLDLEKGFSQAYNTSYNKGYNKGYEDGYKQGYEKGNTEGYTKGMNDWAIWCYCWRCRYAFFIKPNSDDHKKIIEQMKGYLEHSQCPED